MTSSERLAEWMGVEKWGANLGWCVLTKRCVVALEKRWGELLCELYVYKVNNYFHSRWLLVHLIVDHSDLLRRVLDSSCAASSALVCSFSKLLASCSHSSAASCATAFLLSLQFRVCPRLLCTTSILQPVAWFSCGVFLMSLYLTLCFSILKTGARYLLPNGN